MKVVVGLSGGVDSSCAVARLKEAGHEVVAATLLMQQGDVSVPSKESLAQAQELCGTLGVPFIARPMDEAFSRQVLDPFVDAYLSGRTPSPCVACNRYVKVAGLMAIADEVGADKVATGHYISLVEGEDGQAAPIGQRIKATFCASCRRSGCQGSWLLWLPAPKTR